MLIALRVQWTEIVVVFCGPFIPKKMNIWTYMHIYREREREIYIYSEREIYIYVIYIYI